MRKIMLVAAMALASEAALAQDLIPFQIAQATAPEATTQPTAKPSKPVKKRQAKRRETDEEKARRIAAKYGVSW